MHQWIGLVAAVGFLTASLLIPGYLLARLAGAARRLAVPIAPALTIALLEVLAAIFRRAGVHASWELLVLAPSLALALVLAAVRFRCRGASGSVRIPSRACVGMSVLYCALGLAAVTFVFLANLDGPSSFQPDNDNATHLGIIRAFAESGSYSSLAASSYLSASSAPTSAAASFYPAAFHVLPALAVSRLGATPMLAENAMITTVIGVALPLGWQALVWTASDGDRRMTFYGVFLCLSATAFPWRLIVWGPLLPNLLSLSLIPVSIATFIRLARAPSVRGGALFAACLVSVSLAHPGGAFTLGVLLVPYMGFVLWQLPVRGAAPAPARRLMREAGLLAAVAAVWVVCFNLPFLQGTVRFVWWAYQDVPASVTSVLDLSFGRPFPHLFVPVLLVIGLLYTLVRRRWLWVSLGFLFTSAQYVVSASFDGFVDQLLNGFWYSDYNRLAANAGLIGTLLVILGAYAVDRAVARAAGLVAGRAGSAPARAPVSAPARVAGGAATLALAAASAFLAFTPKLVAWDVRSQNTAAGDVQVMINEKYRSSMPHGYDGDEQEFVREAAEIVPDGETVLNLPNDGSCFAYAVDGLDVYYRTVSIYQDVNPGETRDSALLRRDLDELSDRSDVRAAARAIGARYVLLLDQGVPPEEQESYIPVYIPDVWRGIADVGDGTPGFRVVLERGDMRLYEIVD